MAKLPNLAIRFLLLYIAFRHSLVEVVYGYSDSGGTDSESNEYGEYGGGYFQGGYGREYGGPKRPPPYYSHMPGWQFGYATGPFSGGFDDAGWPHSSAGGPFWPQLPPLSTFGAPQYREPVAPMPWPPAKPPAFPIPMPPPQSSCYPPYACPLPEPPLLPGQPSSTEPPLPPGITPATPTEATSTGTGSGGTTTSSDGTGGGQTTSSTTSTPTATGTAITQSGITTTATIASSTISSSQGALSQAQRAAVLQVHNDLRSTLARGTAQNQTGTMPTGTNIIQLVYDTGLEATAQSWSQQCVFEHSEISSRNNSGENLFWTSNLTIPFEQILVKASNFWWQELVNFGIQANLVLSITEFNKGIGHWSQIAWSTTSHLGCGVTVCSNVTYVVCHYNPAGNIIDQVVYKQGNSCGDCMADYSTSCNQTNSLCIAP